MLLNPASKVSSTHLKKELRAAFHSFFDLVLINGQYNHTRAVLTIYNV